VGDLPHRVFLSLFFKRRVISGASHQKSGLTPPNIVLLKKLDPTSFGGSSIPLLENFDQGRVKLVLIDNRSLAINSVAKRNRVGIPENCPRGINYGGCDHKRGE